MQGWPPFTRRLGRMRPLEDSGLKKYSHAGHSRCRRVSLNSLMGWLSLACLVLASFGCNQTPHAASSATAVGNPPALASGGGETAADDWCAGHGVPESKCTLCHPELIDQFKAAGDWCEEHRLPESVCPTCNPGLDSRPADNPAELAAKEVGKYAGWCAGHSVPESKCTLCHPELIPHFKAAGDWCAEHRLPESACPTCNPELGPAPVDNPAELAAKEVGKYAGWCAGHSVPESKCTLCHPELIPHFKAAGDWCAEHRLPESVCPTCNPDLGSAPVDNPALLASNQEGKYAGWCAGHSVPESKCTLCHPELIPHFKELGDWCAEHKLPESVCPTCNPQSLDEVPIENRIVRFVTPDKEAQAGIRTVTVRRGNHVAKVTAPARIEFNADTIADLRTVVSGTVQALHVPIGDKVEPGQLLFELVSPEVGEAQAHLRTARAKARVAQINLDRHRKLAERKIASRMEVEQAEMELETALAEVAAEETTLRTAGATEKGPAGLLSITAPIGGFLVHRTAILGTLATEGTSLGMIADTSHMWVMCDIPEAEAGTVRKEDVLHFRSDDGQAVSGEIAWMAAEVDPKTRTIAVRAQVCNHEGTLRAHQFGRATIETEQTGDVWLVPSSAIQRIEQRMVVFVRREQGIYAPREVTLMGSGDWTPVAGRLVPGDQVVTTGAVLLRTEMLPGSIGAGCCEVEPLGAADRER